ncbi:transcriptional regulator, LuxR family [Arboricoccus pini]|uniref:Transcriptional regulator, LuxR family n=1 Tax=Arboricoccus pini TaxID=1963835 RepID=A0A212RT77_9PROT|nr:PAS domain S-box protein [Arboricoccus pini]SNB75756.1 transcriptional regulator, LuxR family [Arboricoccus pini]
MAPKPVIRVVETRPPSRAALRENASYKRLQQIVAGLSDGVILVETDQSIAWANEAALAMHGVATLADLGEDVADYRRRFELRYRNNHVLDQGRYPLDRVLAGEAFADVVVEVTPKGQPETSWVHRVRSLVLNDDEGAPDCLVLVIKDVSGEMEAEERFEKTFNANPAPALVCKIEDLRFFKVNRGFLDMTSMTADSVIGRSIYELDILSGRDDKENAIQKLCAHQTIPQAEATLRLDHGWEKLVIVAGQAIFMGEEPAMLFTFADLEPRRRAQAALAQSEARFATAFDLSPVPFAIFTLEGFCCVRANEAFLSLLGRERGDVEGAYAADLDLVEPRDSLRQLEHRLAEGMRLRNVELQVKGAKGLIHDCLFSADLVTLEGVPHVLAVFQDITARKRSEDELIQAIQTVMQDTSWFSRTLIEKMAALKPGNRPATVQTTTDLTVREREILALVCRGQSNDEVATSLKLSPNTVRNHLAAIYGKIGVRNRAAAIIWSRDRGLNDP